MQAAIILVLVIIIVVIVVSVMSTSTSTLTSMSPGTSMQTLQSTSMQNPTASNFTFSTWFYINGLNYNFDRHKILLARIVPSEMTSATSAVGSCPKYSDMKNSNPSPLIAITPYTNDIEVSVCVLNGTDSTPSVQSTLVTNVPVQKWVNLLVSIYGRTLDIYLDGKLAKTIVLSGIASIAANENLYVTPCGGFDGWTSKVQYFPNATNPQQAWDIYKAGYGSSFFANSFGQTQLSVSLLQNGTPTRSVVI